MADSLKPLLKSYARRSVTMAREERRTAKLVKRAREEMAAAKAQGKKSCILKDIYYGEGWWEPAYAWRMARVLRRNWTWVDIQDWRWEEEGVPVRRQWIYISWP